MSISAERLHKPQASPQTLSLIARDGLGEASSFTTLCRRLMVIVFQIWNVVPIRSCVQILTWKSTHACSLHAHLTQLHLCVLSPLRSSDNEVSIFNLKVARQQHMHANMSVCIPSSGSSIRHLNARGHQLSFEHRPYTSMRYRDTVLKVEKIEAHPWVAQAEQ